MRAAGTSSGVDILALSKQNPKAVFDLCREENQFYFLRGHVGSPDPRYADYNGCSWLSKKNWKAAIKPSVEIVENILQSFGVWPECKVCGNGVLGLAEHAPAEKHLGRLWALLPLGQPVVDCAKTLWQDWNLPLGILRFNHVHGQVMICRGRRPTSQIAKALEGLQEPAASPSAGSTEPESGLPGPGVPASPLTEPVSFAPPGYHPAPQFAAPAPATPAPAQQRAQDHGFPTQSSASTPSVVSFAPDDSTRFAASSSAAPPAFGSRSMGFPVAPQPSWDAGSEVSFAPANFASPRPSPSEVSFAGANFATQDQSTPPVPAPAVAPAAVPPPAVFAPAAAMPPQAIGVQSPNSLMQEGVWITIQPPCSEPTRARGDYTAYGHLQGKKSFKPAMTSRAVTLLDILQRNGCPAYPQCTVCDRHRGYEEHLGGPAHWNKLYEKRYTAEGQCIEDIKVRLNEVTGEIQMAKGTPPGIVPSQPVQPTQAPQPASFMAHGPAPSSSPADSNLWGRYVPSQPMQPTWGQTPAMSSQPAQPQPAPTACSAVPEMNVSNLKMFIAQKNLESKAKILQTQLLERHDGNLDQYLCSVCNKYVLLHDTTRHFGSLEHLAELAKNPNQEQVFETNPPLRLRHVDVTLEINEGSTRGECYDV